MGHPYEDLPKRAFWKTAVAEPGPDGIVGIADCRRPLKREDRIATAGSCFAQHIARRLHARGFNYLDVEPAPRLLSAEDRMRFGYGLFSARYGNIYTTTQLRQLIDRASGRFVPAERTWHKDGRWYDPFRPSIEPNGFASEEEAIVSQAAHLRAVIRLLRQTDVFIFTLGLTEAWRSREDGAIYPICPGIIAGTFDPERHEFVNLNHAEVLRDMNVALRMLRKYNPSVRVLLTVSPVPLTATASGSHVLTATTHSKSVLRAVAGQLTTTYDWVDYFPSYELVTAPVFRGRAYETNMRSVREAGVDFVMDTFFREFCREDDHQPMQHEQPGSPAPRGDATPEIADDVACDEAALEFYAR